MHFPLAFALLGLLTSFVNAAPPSIGRRNNGGDPTSISPTKTAQATTRTVTVDCPTATASATASSAPSSGTSYVLVVSNGTLSGSLPAGSGGNGSITVSLLSIESEPGINSTKANLTSSAGTYIVPTAQDDASFFVRNEYGNITVNRVSLVDSASVIPSATSPAAPTATAGFFGDLLDDFNNLIDDIGEAVGDLVNKVLEDASTPGVDFTLIPLVVVELVDDALDIVVDVVEIAVDVVEAVDVLDALDIVVDVLELAVDGVQIVDGVVERVGEEMEKILDRIGPIPRPIVPPPFTLSPAPSSSAYGPIPTGSGGQGSGLLGIRSVRRGSALVVVCRDGTGGQGGNDHH
jgi:hypothetical protein